MAVTIDIARTAREKEAVYKLRYSVYTKEMHLFRSTADHDRQILVDHEDDGAQLFYAIMDGEAAGAIRMHLGRDNAIPAKYREIYEIDRFSSFIPTEKMAIFTRFTVAEKHHSGRVPYGLMLFVYEYCLKEGVQVGFCDCVPSLIHLYLKLGWRRYLNKSISDPEFGLQIPLCMISYDLRHLEAIGSPFASSYRRICGGEPTPEWLDQIAEILPYSKHAQEALEHSWSKIFKLLVEHRKTTVFDGLSEDVVQALIQMGDLIECRKGQSIIKAGTVYKNIFIYGRICHERRGPRCLAARAGHQQADPFGIGAGLEAAL